MLLEVNAFYLNSDYQNLKYPILMQANDVADFTGYSAGAAGYITYNFNHPDGRTFANVFFSTGLVSGTSGIQFTPINYTNGLLYVQYYCPKAIQSTGSVLISATALFV